MQTTDWIQMAMNAFDYITTTIEENHPEEHKTTPSQPIVTRLPITKTYTASAKGYLEIALRESLANTLYLDSGGVKTIGIGMTTSEIKDLNNWPWARRIETVDCVNMFVTACKKYETAINKALKVKVMQNEFDVLLSITYNIGIGGMQNSTFMKRINAGDTKDNIVQAMSWWNKDNGKVVKGLINRRTAEGKLFKDGIYANKGEVPYISVNSNHKPMYNSMINLEKYFK